jgi:hypothetical protein
MNLSLLPIDNLLVGWNWIVSDCNESSIFQLIPIIFKLTPDIFWIKSQYAPIKHFPRISSFYRRNSSFTKKWN